MTPSDRPPYIQMTLPMGGIGGVAALRQLYIILMFIYSVVVNGGKKKKTGELRRRKSQTLVGREEGKGMRKHGQSASSSQRRGQPALVK